MAEVKNINTSEFEQTISRGKVLIDFRAPWCSACKVLDLIIERNPGDLPDDLTIAKINVDDNETLAADFKVTMIPTLMLYIDGKLTARESGNFSRAAFLDFIKPAL